MAGTTGLEPAASVTDPGNFPDADFGTTSESALTQLPVCTSPFQEGIVEKRSITLIGRNTSATVAMPVRFSSASKRQSQQGACLAKSSRGPRGISVAGSP